MQPINPATGSISYSLTALPPQPPPPTLFLLTHTHTYTHPSYYYYNKSHALCACALSLSSNNLFFFPLCIFLGRIVLHVTSAQYYGVLQKVTRRRRICEWTPWCVPAHRSEGGGTSADAPWAPSTPPRTPATPPRSPSLPPHEWGSLRYQLCHRAGVGPNPPASCAFQNLKARLSYLMILYDFFCCAFVGLEARCPPVFPSRVSQKHGGRIRKD